MARLRERDPMIRWSNKHTENQLLVGAIVERPHHITNAARGAGGGIAQRRRATSPRIARRRSDRPYLTSARGDPILRRALHVAIGGE